ncbi:hypothetical protein [Escherichia coli]|uniref:hypothetical protein n=1 Tax=Escherichia coli TaxID=562 RepID=UPI001580F77A|nr:hypothetical protein [Escherichia coli]NUG46873.1 hypothetical protein [Escherichia coli]
MTLHLNFNLSVKIKNLFQLIFILFTLFSVSYNFTPVVIPTAYLSIVVMFITFLYQIYTVGKVTIINRSSLIFCSLFILSSILSYLLNFSKTDAYMIRISTMYFLIILFTPAIYILMFKRNDLLILKIIGYAGFINAIFIITMLVIPSFQSFYLSFINSSTLSLIGSDAIENAMSLRMIGITGFSVYFAGFMQILCALFFTIYIYYKNGNNFKPSIFEIFILAFILLSSIIAARSSFIGVTILIFIIFKLANIFQFLKITLFNIAILLGSLTVLIVFLPSHFQDFFIHWLTEFFQSGKETGSLQENINMFRYNWNDFSSIGDSRWFGDNNDYYMNVDVGWYRILFSVGYLGLLFWLFTIVCTLGLNNIFSLKFTNEQWITISILIYIFIMNLKGAILFDSFQSVFLLAILNLIFKSRRNKKYS